MVLHSYGVPWSQDLFMLHIYPPWGKHNWKARRSDIFSYFHVCCSAEDGKSFIDISLVFSGDESICHGVWGDITTQAQWEVACTHKKFWPHFHEVSTFPTLHCLHGIWLWGHNKEAGIWKEIQGLKITMPICTLSQTHWNMYRLFSTRIPYPVTKKTRLMLTPVCSTILRPTIPAASLGGSLKMRPIWNWQWAKKFVIAAKSLKTLTSSWTHWNLLLSRISMRQVYERWFTAFTFNKACLFKMTVLVKPVTF